jgi:hypothetical protein
VSDEQNNAERQAEEILEAEYTKAKAEECPQGTNCPVHFRVNEEYFDHPAEYARLITYMGDYVVITEDNHVLSSPLEIVKILLGMGDNSTPRFETTILYVGSGAIGDFEAMGEEEYCNLLRYAHTHNVWEEVKAQHDQHVALLEAGLIDVSKPWKE